VVRRQKFLATVVIRKPDNVLLVEQRAALLARRRRDTLCLAAFAMSRPFYVLAAS
jgi:hypothetical protein